MEKKLGKLTKVRFGAGGHDGAMFGLSVVLDAGDSQWSDFKGCWARRSPTAQWSVEDGQRYHAETMQFLMDIMRQAKVHEVHELEGMPIEVTMNGITLESWRILEEVL